MFFDTVADLLSARESAALQTVTPDTSAREAVRLMNRCNVGAVLVLQGDALVGILTEGDVMRKVVATGLDSTVATVAQVMTPNPPTLRCHEHAVRALDLMATGRCAHVPVLERDVVRGVLSPDDLNAWLTRELRTQVDGALKALRTMGKGQRGRSAITPLRVLLTPPAPV